MGYQWEHLNGLYDKNMVALTMKHVGLYRSPTTNKKTTSYNPTPVAYISVPNPKTPVVGVKTVRGIYPRS